MFLPDHAIAGICVAFRKGPPTLQVATILVAMVTRILELATNLNRRSPIQRLKSMGQNSRQNKVLWALWIHLNVKFKFICHLWFQPTKIETKMKWKFNSLILRTQDHQYDKEQSYSMLIKPGAQQFRGLVMSQIHRRWMPMSRTVQIWVFICQEWSPTIAEIWDALRK